MTKILKLYVLKKSIEKILLYINYDIIILVLYERNEKIMEVLRKKLDSLVKENNLNNIEIIKLSQELDKLIVEKQRALNEKKINIGKVNNSYIIEENLKRDRKSK